MEVVTGATGSVLAKVGVLLQEEYIRQKGVKKDVESLQKELFFMRAALCKVAEVPPEQLDEQVKAWASNVKELSYNMEDAVDTFNVRGKAIKQDRPFWSIDKETFNRLWARHKLADVIAEMKDLTVQVADLRDRYKLDDLNAKTSTIVQKKDLKPVVVPAEYSLLWGWWCHCISSPWIQDMVTRWPAPRLISTRLAVATNSHRPQSLGPRLIAMKDPCGMSKEMKKLGAWVVKRTAVRDDGVNGDGRVIGKTTANNAGDDTKGTVLYVHGNRGVGKTTLAVALYRKFGHKFKCRARVEVSSMGSDLKAIHENITDQFGANSEPDENPADDTTGYKPLGELVLIDGVELDETEKLKKIRDGLPKDCKIIVTTRHAMVASSFDKKNGDKRHDMAALGEKEAREIFMDALSRPTEDGDDHKKEKRKSGKENIPSRVWMMCSEEPVALIAMSGYAACNPDLSPEEWGKICSNLFPDPVKPLTGDGVPRVLSHCYHDMPAEMKTCLLYLSMYQKGTVIRRKHLTRRWIAEGFVGELPPGKSVEEVADDYFEKLVKRKMIQPLEESSSGKVKNCQVHELIYDFIVYKASEENLVTVVGSGNLLPPPSGKVRRLSYSDPDGADRVEHNIYWQKLMKKIYGEKMVGSVGSMSHVRSLAVIWDLNMGSKILPYALLDSPIVQVLDLEGCRDPLLETQHMKVICKMLLLKYLNLRGTCIMKITKDIDNLKNLTLDVRGTEVKELPRTIWNLQHLVSLLGGNKKEKIAMKLQLPVHAATSTAAATENNLPPHPAAAFTTELIHPPPAATASAKVVELNDTICHLPTQMASIFSGNRKKRNESAGQRTRSYTVKMKALRVLSGIEITKELAQLLYQLPSLRKLVIYEVHKNTNSDGSMSVFLSHGRCLRKLVIKAAGDGNLSGFFNHSPTPSLKLLHALELCGKLEKMPTWIQDLADLTKLALPIAVFSADPLLLAKLHKLKNLFSLTFSGAELQLPHGKEIIVPTGGFPKLKLLHFCAAILPPLSFLDDAMPRLERIQLCFRKFEGLHGIHNLKMLQEVHLKVHVDASEFTISMVNNLADAMSIGTPRIIRDRYKSGAH